MSQPMMSLTTEAHPLILVILASVVLAYVILRAVADLLRRAEMDDRTWRLIRPAISAVCRFVVWFAREPLNDDGHDQGPIAEFDCFDKTEAGERSFDSLLRTVVSWLWRGARRHACAPWRAVAPDREHKWRVAGGLLLLVGASSAWLAIATGHSREGSWMALIAAAGMLIMAAGFVRKGVSIAFASRSLTAAAICLWVAADDDSASPVFFWAFSSLVVAATVGFFEYLQEPLVARRRGGMFGSASVLAGAALILFSGPFGIGAALIAAGGIVNPLYTLKRHAAARRALPGAVTTVTTDRTPSVRCARAHPIILAAAIISSVGVAFGIYFGGVDRGLW